MRQFREVVNILAIKDNEGARSEVIIGWDPPYPTRLVEGLFEEPQLILVEVGP